MTWKKSMNQADTELMRSETNGEGQIESSSSQLEVIVLHRWACGTPTA